MSHSAIIAIGSNLGDRVENLRFAVANLAIVKSVSNVFETAPIGGPDNQGAYLNMVCTIETELDPLALLRNLNEIEALAGRVREIHWGPRTLDLDILFYDDITLESEVLTIPHPRYSQRRFVLAPLEQVAPDRCPNNWSSTLPPDEVRDIGRLNDL